MLPSSARKLQSCARIGESTAHILLLRADRCFPSCISFPARGFGSAARNREGLLAVINTKTQIMLCSSVFFCGVFFCGVFSVAHFFCGVFPWRILCVFLWPQIAIIPVARLWRW
jgi:hypothetical protein